MEARQPNGGVLLGRPAWLWSLAALGLGLALSVMAATIHRDSLARAEYNRLERLSESAFDAVDGKLHTCGLLVRSMQALFLSSDHVSPEEFQAMYDSLRPREQFPSLQAVAFARRSGAPAPGAEADGREHYLTDLVAPLSGNDRLIGLDVLSQPANMTALRFSRDSDRPVMSAPFKLIQRSGLPGGNDGITIRLPVFSAGPLPRDLAERRAREIGSLAASFQVSRLIVDALPQEARERFAVRVEDITDGQPALLFADHDFDAVAADAAGFQTRQLSYGGRTWRLEAVARPDPAAATWMPGLTLAIGMLASGLMATLAWSIAHTRSRALSLAGEMSHQFRESEERFRALNELLPALVVLARAEDGALVYANQAFRDRFGTDEQRPLPLLELIEEPALRDRVAAIARSPGSIFNETARLRAPGQSPFWATLSVSLIQLQGRPHLLAVANDITELRVLSEELSYQASHDSLTNLYNRREFERRLDAAIMALDAGGPSCALLYLDLDQFKLINDTSGHYAGDQLLAQLASLLAGSLPEGVLMARLGGDEFALLIERTEEPQAMALAEQVRATIDGYIFGWEDRNYTISASIGVVMMRGPGLSQRTLLAHADTACYMAKERGRNRVHLFSEEDSETSKRRSEMEWAGRIREALSEGRFELHFQELGRSGTARRPRACTWRCWCACATRTAGWCRPAPSSPPPNVLA